MEFEEIFNFKLLETEKVTVSIYSLLISIAIIIGVIILLRIIKNIFKRLESRKRIDIGSSSAFYLIIKYFVFIISMVLILGTLGINVSILIASFAALLVGVGLGLQQLFNDIASGIIMLFERNLMVSDVIQLDDGTVGRVKSIGIRTSKIISRDDTILIVPNSKFVNDTIINWSHIEEKTRFHINIGVAYGSDIVTVENTLLDCIKDHPDISGKPSPFVRFTDFGDSSLDFQLFFWVEQSFEVENIKSDLRFLIDKKFRENKIQIPFPQRDVHFIKSE